MSTPESLAHDAEHERQVEAAESGHDEFCPQRQMHVGVADSALAWTTYYCRCDLIARVRADERRKARAEFNEAWKTNLPLINARTRDEAIRDAVSRVGRTPTFRRLASFQQSLLAAAIKGDNDE